MTSSSPSPSCRATATVSGGINIGLLCGRKHVQPWVGGVGGAAFGSRCQSGVLELEQAAEYQEPASIKEKLEHLPLYSAPNFNLWVLVLPGSCVEFF